MENKKDNSLDQRAEPVCIAKENMYAAERCVPWSLYHNRGKKVRVADIPNPFVTTGQRFELGAAQDFID